MKDQKDRKLMDSVHENYYLTVLRVADAAVVRPGRFWSDAFLTDGH